jgi:nicotinamidase-related amidase
MQVPVTLEEFVHPASTALVMWDMQKGLAGRAINVDAIRDTAQRLLTAARKAAVPVIWSRHVLPPLALTAEPFLLFLMKKQKVDHPDKLQPSMQEGMEETEFLPGLSPDANDIVLEKSQPSLFVDTPLNLRLRTLGVRTLVLTGVATEIGVEFTARHAAALGYHSVIIEDATGSYTLEAHERSLAFLRGWTSPVVKAASVIDVWER